jgi:hypothetical protein
VSSSKTEIELGDYIKCMCGAQNCPRGEVVGFKDHGRTIYVWDESRQTQAKIICYNARKVTKLELVLK